MRISDWSSDVCSSDLVIVQLIIKSDCPTRLFAFVADDTNAIGKAKSSLLITGFTIHIVCPQAAAACIDLVPAIASAKIQLELPGDIDPDLAINSLILVFYMSRYRHARHVADRKGAERRSPRSGRQIMDKKATN